MATSGRRPLIAVVFDEPAWAEDLARLNRPQRELAERTRRRIERDGLTLGAPDLYACLAEGPDATNLAGCVKHYADELRLVLTGDVAADGQKRLLCIAVGLGHPHRAARTPSAYQIAHRRLHGG
jgi:hypothetical protein